jgi:hypothetical protein
VYETLSPQLPCTLAASARDKMVGFKFSDRILGPFFPSRRQKHSTEERNKWVRLAELLRHLSADEC